MPNATLKAHRSLLTLDGTNDCLAFITDDIDINSVMIALSHNTLDSPNEEWGRVVSLSVYAVLRRCKNSHCRSCNADRKLPCEGPGTFLSVS